jgi:hypothetical protein
MNPLEKSCQHAGLEGLDSVVVGLCVTEAASTVTLLGNDGTSALAGLEAAASVGAVRIALAWAGDELGALGRRGGSSGGGIASSVVSTSTSSSSATSSCTVTVVDTVALSTWENGIGSLDFLCGDVVGFGVTVAASTVTGLSNDGTGAFARVEAAASACTVRIACASASDELCACTSDLLAWEGGTESLDFLSGNVVGLGITVAASTVTGLSNDGTCALARVEATARGCAVGIRLARACDELCARGSTGNVGRSDGESQVKGNKCTDDRDGDHDDEEVVLKGC